MRLALHNSPQKGIFKFLFQAPVAQLVEQLTLNQRALGSNPSRRTIKPRNTLRVKWGFIFLKMGYTEIYGSHGE